MVIYRLDGFEDVFFRERPTCIWQAGYHRRMVVLMPCDSLILVAEAIGEQGESALGGIKIEKGLASALVEVASKSAKKAKAEVVWTLSLTSYSANGVEDVKKILSSAAKAQDAQLSLHYLGAPHYQMKAVAEDFKRAEKALEEAAQSMEASAKQLGAHLEIQKTEN